jgi:predicted nuclease of predicted toxin-antitoxin system
VSLAFVVDMNLSPDWTGALAGAGFQAVHWSAVGPAATTDVDIMAWARTNGRTLLTHDLDFGALLAATNAVSPSVVLLRGDDVLPETLASAVTDAINRHRASLESGALLVADIRRSRLRLLPFRAVDEP